MAPKKKSPDAQKVEKFLDDLRQNMHDHAPVTPAKQNFVTFAASSAALLLQAAVFGVIGGVFVRIVRFIAGF
jgi:hypothetical protein